MEQGLAASRGEAAGEQAESGAPEGAAAPEEQPQDAAQASQKAQGAEAASGRDEGGELPEDSQIQSLQAEIEALKGQLKDQADKARADLERMARAAAESDNRRKRAEADVERERKYGNEKLLKALLPVVDSLELAMQHIDKNSEAMKPTYEGISNTMRLFLKELSEFGVVREDPQGKPFDPSRHQAVSMVESTEVGNNCVLSVMQKGFILNGRVVRPAMVVVAKNSGEKQKPDSAKAAEGSGEDKKQGKTINIEA